MSIYGPPEASWPQEYRLDLATVTLPYWLIQPLREAILARLDRDKADPDAIWRALRIFDDQLELLLSPKSPTPPPGHPIRD